MRTDDIVAYVARADLYCPTCTLRRFGGIDAHVESTESALDMAAATLGIDRQDERSFDSGLFPKVVFRDQIEPEDRCGECGQSLAEVWTR